MPYKYIFGPVPSRRLGRSLGVDIIPSKLCTLDCVYCEVGKTDKRGLARKEYYPTNEILDEVRRALQEFTAIDHITLSGSGEPTLHSGIGTILHGIKQMTTIPVAVLTNGTLFSLQEVRQALLEADIVSPSLDAVTEAAFQKVDRPHPKLHLAEIIEGLRQFRAEYRGQLWIEVLFVKGYNDAPEDIQRLKEVLDSLRPDKIHINTIVRPPAEPTAQPLSNEQLWYIKNFLGEKAEVISTAYTVHTNSGDTLHEESILAALERRPMTMNDIVQSLSIPEEKLQILLQKMLSAHEVGTEEFDGKVFYVRKK